MSEDTRDRSDTTPSWSGFWFGLTVSVVALATWMFAEWDEPARYSVWAVPALFLVGLTMVGMRRRPRFGCGLMLGTMAASAVAFAFVWALVSALSYA